jgi:hypothetical protein
MTFVTFLISNNIPSTINAIAGRTFRANTLTLNPTAPPTPALTPATQPLTDPAGNTAPAPPAGPAPPLPQYQWFVGLEGIRLVGQANWHQWQYARLWLNPAFEEAILSFSYNVTLIRNSTGQNYPPPPVTLTYDAQFNPGGAVGNQLQQQRTTVIRDGVVFVGATMNIMKPFLLPSDFQYNSAFDEYVIRLAINSI